MAGSIFHVHPLQCIYFCRTHPRAGPPLVTTPTPGLLRSFQHPLLFFNFPNVSFQMKMAALCPPASASSKCNTWPFHCCVATRRNNSFSGSILSFPWLFHLLGFLKLSLCLFKSSSKLNSVLFPIVFTSCPATRIPLTQTLLFWLIPFCPDVVSPYQAEELGKVSKKFILERKWWAPQMIDRHSLCRALLPHAPLWASYPLSLLIRGLLIQGSTHWESLIANSTKILSTMAGN